ncbi:spindle and kinetochore-associated protein 1 homolog [Dendrobium catenatum]|uniref:SKA complex subunit 1 homolog n=1 Tax=Dendrobium catenatum TaxID=906689 RepID=A0A2I0VK34_9ASPA|nr:spindle and kinetochore-associated protein 1 homolog [Dendrobium catenatum]PKU63765.1 Spindle and kinetochore-associated protein 1 like [Dendrobium catenatum]
MDLREASSSLDTLVSSFNARIMELQELVLARNMPSTSMPDLTAMDSTLTAMESQIQAIKNRLQEERSAIPKAKKLIQQSLHQQKKLHHMLANMPSGMRENVELSDFGVNASFNLNLISQNTLTETSISKDEIVLVPKEKKGRRPAPRWYVTALELDSLSTYMRGRLTLDKINIAVNEMAAHADANSQLIARDRKKLSDTEWDRALELRDITMSPEVKGKHFLLESDIKGPGLKLDNTGKATLTVLRHLGRIQEFRIGFHRIMTLLEPQ